jgi:hypothetical protein
LRAWTKNIGVKIPMRPARSNECAAISRSACTEEAPRGTTPMDSSSRNQGYCVVGLLLVTASMRSCGRWLARLVARAMLVSPLLRW